MLLLPSLQVGSSVGCAVCDSPVEAGLDFRRHRYGGGIHPATIRTELARPGRRTDSDEASYRWPFLRLAFLFLCLRPLFPFELAPV